MNGEVGHVWISETTLEDIGGYVFDLQTKLRMGTYSEELDGSLAEVLDEIERMLR